MSETGQPAGPSANYDTFELPVTATFAELKVGRH
jgi:hypothetical protein